MDLRDIFNSEVNDNQIKEAENNFFKILFSN